MEKKLLLRGALSGAVAGLIAFIFAQRYFIQGIAMSGIKD